MWLGTYCCLEKAVVFCGWWSDIESESTVFEQSIIVWYGHDVVWTQTFFQPCAPQAV